MKTPIETLALVQRHVQKYNNQTGGSCAASGIEMILKLEGLVPDNFYEIQDKYQYQNTGFAEFDGKNIHGLVFRARRLPWRDLSLTEAMLTELNAGRYFLVSLPVGGWHVFVVFLHNQDDFHAVSKFGTFETGTEPMILNMITTLCQFLKVLDELDILTYSKPELIGS